jgi:DNA invertase Pin-like site-specific DNA recombinase
MMLGYQMVPDEKDPRGRGKLVIAPEEAETVKKIFAMYVDGVGYKAIVNCLNSEGRVGKNGRPRYCCMNVWKTHDNEKRGKVETS